MGSFHVDERAPTRNWMVTGAVMGLVAGVVFILFEMIVAAAMGNAFFAPLRMISSLVLGEGALTPRVGMGTAVAVGLIVHFALSALFGVVFGLIERVSPALHDRKGGLIVWGTVYGIGLWVVNFYLFAQFIWPWFLETNQLVQFVAHSLFYGLPLGMLMALRMTVFASQGPGGPIWPRPD